MDRKLENPALWMALTIIVVLLASAADFDSGAVIFALPVLVGVFAGVLKFSHQAPVTTEDLVEKDWKSEIRTDSIPIRGGLGAGLLVALLMLALMMELPAVRWMALPGLVMGVIWGTALALKHRHV